MARHEEIIRIAKEVASKIHRARSFLGRRFTRPNIPLQVKLAVLVRDGIQCLEFGDFLGGSNG